MNTGTKVLIAVVIVGVLGAATVMQLQNASEGGTEVRAEEVVRRSLVSTVTTSGNIRAGRTVDISSDVVGRVTRLHIREGEAVEAGDTLLQIDPAQFNAAVSRNEASLSQARSQVAQQQATLDRAQREYDRLRGLFSADSQLVSRQELENALTDVEVADRQLESLNFGVEQASAALEEAQENLSKTIIRSPMRGTVTRLSIEEGETAVMGTMNNPGSLLLTISELSTVEAVVQVDETDIPKISLGDSAVVELDAFPDLFMAGRVTEIGNSAIQSPTSAASAGQSVSIDFEVVITLDNPIGGIRPDLSATADIVTEVRTDALSIPIIALTVRDEEGLVLRDESTSSQTEGPEQQQAGPALRPEDTDVEGVFVIRDGQVDFVPVEVGITGLEYFEVLSGLEEGDVVVSGPYQTIRTLLEGDRVRISDDSSDS